MFASIHARSRIASLPKLASEFSPQVECTSPDTVVFSIEGLGRLIGGPQEIAAAICRRGAELGIEANLAIAANPDTAVLAARHLPGVTLIPPGQEAEILGPLPIYVLPAQPDTIETLKRWGIRTLAGLAELPPLDLIARLGQQGHYLRLLALGQTSRSLQPVIPPQDYSAGCEVEHPISLLEPLLFRISRLVNDLLRRLAEHSLATDQATLNLILVNSLKHTRTTEFPFPVRDPSVILRQLHLDLEAHPPSAPVIGLKLTLRPAKPRSIQTGLFVPAAPEPEKLQVLIAKLTALCGKDRVGSPELLDTHRPDACRMRPLVCDGPRQTVSETTAPQGTPLHAAAIRLAFRFFRPALAASVRLASGRPLHLAAEGIRGRVLAAAGPWRTSGDWWTGNPWARDEWDAALEDGGIYRIYQPHGAGVWYVEGVYD
jgi:protein ImuB